MFERAAHTVLRIARRELHLFADGSLYLPDVGCLLVADAHIGKAASFRRLGVPVPSGSSRQTLAAIDKAVARTGARELVLLGDFLHSAHAQAERTQATLRAWRDRCPALTVTLVRGNHDARAGDPPADLRVRVVDEPWPLGDASLLASHHPRPAGGGYVLAGHWHPCVTLHGRAGDAVRAPCFWFGDERTRPVGVLPAFGAFTGMHPIERHAGDRVHVCSGEAVRELPARSREAAVAGPGA